jgi:Tfp pilus assembly protein PilO
VTRSRTMLIAGAAALAILVLWYLVLWSPRKAELNDAREERQAAESTRQELSTRVARLRASQKDEPIKRAQLEALRTTIPDDPNLAAFILDTNDAAAKAGIDWISVSPEEPSPGTASTASVAAAPVTTTGTGAGTDAGTTAANRVPAEVRLQLQITGGYFQVLDFLNRLNEMPRLVVTDGLNISSDDKAKLQVSLKGRMFVRTVPPGFGDVPAVLPVAPPATTSAGTAPAAGATTTPAPASATPPPTATAAPAATASTTGARS